MNYIQNDKVYNLRKKGDEFQEIDSSQVKHHKRFNFEPFRHRERQQTSGSDNQNKHESLKV